MYEYPPLEKDEKKHKIKPFTVHFCNKILIGKSYVRIGLPRGIPHTVTDKFYIRDQYNFDPNDIEKQYNKLIIKESKNKYSDYMTENQKYGWYQNVKLTNIDKNDKRVHFANRMDPLIKLFYDTMEQKPIKCTNKAVNKQK